MCRVTAPTALAHGVGRPSSSSDRTSSATVAAPARRMRTQPGSPCTWTGRWSGAPSRAGTSRAAAASAKGRRPLPREMTLDPPPMVRQCTALGTVTDQCCTPVC